MENKDNFNKQIQEIKINNFPKNFSVDINEKKKIPWAVIFAIISIFISFASLMYAMGKLGSSKISTYSDGLYISLFTILANVCV